MRFFNSKVFIYLLIEIPIIILLGKAYLINTYFVANDDAFSYRMFQSVSHDSIIYFFILLFTYISYQKITPYILSIFLRIVSLTIFIIYLIDIYILNQFANHLVLNDIFKYVSYAPKYIEQFYKLNIFLILLFLIITIFSIYFIIKKFEIKSSKIQYTCLSAIIAFLLLYQFAQNGRFIHSWLFKNFVEYNIETYEQSKEYTDSFINNLKVKEDIRCEKSKSETPNIIILMVESLASYQSKYFSNIKNWTPNLDNIAKENISFLNFYANGFVTEDAEIAMITGEIPIYATKSFSNGGGVSFEGFYNIKNSLPNILKNYDYNSEFITSSDLEFSNTGSWALSNGFNYTEGSENPYYKNKERYHFNAAADEYLYDRVLDRLKRQNSKYFLFVKTVTSHAPFINPENHSNSEEETIRYIDKQIGKFYKNLEKENFFDNGILIILGDHHPVIPVKTEALKKYGELRAPSIVPLVVAYNNKKLVHKELFQQTDIYNTLKNLVSKNSCSSLYQGDFLSSNIATSEYIFHRRGDQRGIISVFSNNIDFNVKLLGDETHIVNNTDNKEIINKINSIRINRLKEEYQIKK